MTSFYKENDKIVFEGIRGIITTITETYRKNVLVVNVTFAPCNIFGNRVAKTIGLFEYPDGKIEFMNIID